MLVPRSRSLGRRWGTRVGVLSDLLVHGAPHAQTVAPIRRRTATKSQVQIAGLRSRFSSTPNPVFTHKIER
jgi:hypothetical protein